MDESRRPAAGGAIFSFVCGLHFALLQFSYFFLLEAYLSSQYLSYFVTMFFWLCGFLAGLVLRGDRWLWRLLAAGTLTYYAAWALTRWIPFHPGLYPTVAVCSIVSGVLPGYFFPFMARRFVPVRRFFFHENNGFILGILLSLRGSIHFGTLLLGVGPAAGALLVLITGLAAGVTKSAPDRSLDDAPGERLAADSESEAT